MKFFCIAFVALAVFLCGTTASPVLGGLDDLVDTCVQNVDQVSTPVNRVLEKTGLSACKKTVNVNKYIGHCIPASFKCVGINVLDTLTNKVVNIPACKGKGHHKIVLQQQQQQS